MNVYEMVLGIIMVVVIGRVLRERHRTRETAPTALPTDPDAARLREEVVRLRERVQVLERVVTDNHQSADLDRRIEQLRDH